MSFVFFSQRSRLLVCPVFRLFAFGVSLRVSCSLPCSVYFSARASVCVLRVRLPYVVLLTLRGSATFPCIFHGIFIARCFMSLRFGFSFACFSFSYRFAPFWFFIYLFNVYFVLLCLFSAVFVFPPRFFRTYFVRPSHISLARFFIGALY